MSVLFSRCLCCCLQRGICNVVPCLCCRNTTLSGLVNGVAELVHFVGWISTVGLRLENNSILLLYFILDFYETVCIPVILSFFSSAPKAVCIFKLEHKKNLPHCSLHNFVIKCQNIPHTRQICRWKLLLLHPQAEVNMLLESGCSEFRGELRKEK